MVTLNFENILKSRDNVSTKYSVNFNLLCHDSLELAVNLIITLR